MFFKSIDTTIRCIPIRTLFVFMSNMIVRTNIMCLFFLNKNYDSNYENGRNVRISKYGNKVFGEVNDIVSLMKMKTVLTLY